MYIEVGTISKPIDTIEYGDNTSQSQTPQGSLYFMKTTP